jgi:hypothetical protein
MRAGTNVTCAIAAWFFLKPYKKTGWPSENVRVQERALQTNKILGYSFIVENMGSRDILYEC